MSDKQEFSTHMYTQVYTHKVHTCMRVHTHVYTHAHTCTQHASTSSMILVTGKVMGELM